MCITSTLSSWWSPRLFVLGECRSWTPHVRGSRKYVPANFPYIISEVVGLRWVLKVAKLYIDFVLIFFIWICHSLLSSLADFSCFVHVRTSGLERRWQPSKEGSNQVGHRQLISLSYFWHFSHSYWWGDLVITSSLIVHTPSPQCYSRQMVTRGNHSHGIVLRGLHHCEGGWTRWIASCCLRLLGSGKLIADSW